MIKQKIIIILLAFIIVSLHSCSDNASAEIGISGHFQDEQGNSLDDVSIFYSKSSVSTQTDSVGNYSIDQARTLFIEFKKEGYQTITTKIENFSDNGSYDYGKIILKKGNSKPSLLNDVIKSDPAKNKNLKLFGKVTDVFQQPLKNVHININDEVQKSYDPIYEGDFSFRVLDNHIAMEKNGFQNITIDLPVFEKAAQNFTMVENTPKKGIFLLKAGKYISLPQTKLNLKSEEKTGSILWGGTFSYNITDFYYPENAKEFKIENDSILRFFIFELDSYSFLLKAQSDNGYLCTADYKLSGSPSPTNKIERLNIHEIYPAKYAVQKFDSPKIIEFKPKDTGRNYVFVNTETKKGYYFTY